MIKYRTAHPLSLKLAIARRVTAAAITFKFIKVAHRPAIIILSEFPVAPAAERLVAIAEVPVAPPATVTAKIANAV